MDEFVVIFTVLAVGFPLIRREPAVAAVRLALIVAGMVTASLLVH